MSDKSTNNDNIKNALESLESAATTPSNDAVTGVEVVKGDTVVYEDGDFEDYNADKDYEVDEETKSGKDDESNKDDQDGNSDKEDKHSTTIANIYQWASKLKDDFISDKKEAKSDEEDKSDSENEDKHEDKHSATIANIYQWAAKLKDDFTSEASNMTLDVSEKAVAIMLNRLLDAKTAELEAFDKKVADSEGSVDNAEEERSKIAEKKDKYQGMIDQLQG